MQFSYQNRACYFRTAKVYLPNVVISKKDFFGTRWNRLIRSFNTRTELTVARARINPNVALRLRAIRGIPAIRLVVFDARSRRKHFQSSDRLCWCAVPSGSSCVLRMCPVLCPDLLDIFSPCHGRMCLLFVLSDFFFLSRFQFFEYLNLKCRRRVTFCRCFIDLSADYFTF